MELKDMQNRQYDIADYAARNACKLTECERVLFLTCINSFTFGCNWGFLKAGSPNFKETVKSLQSEKKYIRLDKVSNGVLVTCDEGYLMQIFSTLFEGKCPISYRTLAERRKTEPDVFGTWLKRVIKSPDKLDYIKPTSDGRVMVFGTYGINDTHEIRVNGVGYPAFKLSLFEAVNFMAQRPEFRDMQILLTDRNGVSQFMPIYMIGNNAEYLEYLYLASRISEANTGLFIKVKFSTI